jgi:acyl-CoA synthetase (AMP-forming)/AMP-acid ligase II
VGNSVSTQEVAATVPAHPPVADVVAAVTVFTRVTR